uniref:non-specific serine/threonine protein kinase n=1 Tax=Nicotiana benthamiana TaxID=4100 RepID=A0A0K1U1R7_NICBE|nr:clade XVI lectin receptor kinase [Nicotiana benthamiana]
MGLLTAKLNTIFIFLCCLQSISQAKLKKFDKQYGPFDETYYDIFQVVPPATISNQALQVTSDYAKNLMILFNNAGRILFEQSFKLWDDSSKRVASFNSSFLVNIYRVKNETATEGLTFLISPDLELPTNSLTNGNTDGRSANKVIAVELDTFKQEFDPDDNHIGIDIHSVISVKVESLTPHGIELAGIGARFYNIWVQYDGIKKVLDVYIVEQTEVNGSTPPRPENPILTHDVDLRDVVNQESYFGFSASTGNFSQLNCVLRWNLTVLGFICSILDFVTTSGYYYHKKKAARSESITLGALKSLPGMPRDFEFKVLKKATNNFDEKNKLGEGGFGVVYKGYLVGENLEIAVKWFSRESIKGQDDFLAELTLSTVFGINIFKLLGWSHKHGKLLLIYKYMPNGSLDKHLFSGPDKKPLSWQIRYKIISGKVIHRDLKANNIMLDSKSSKYRPRKE